MRILFDTNVLLDLLLRRQPFVREASILVNAVESQMLGGMLGATTVTTVYYLVERHLGADAARDAIERLLTVFEVAAVGRTALVSALDSGFDDFEDAVLHEAARHASADGIVTRNAGDFAKADIPVYTPEQLLEIIREEMS